MNTEEAVRELAVKVGWEPEALSISLGAMGGTNTSYRCRYRGEDYVFRICSRCSALLAIDRRAEEAAVRAVSEHGLGVPLVFYDKENGNMVTRYVPGNDLHYPDLENPETLDEIVVLARKLHRLRTPFLHDVYGEVEAKLNAIRDNGIVLHPDFERAYDCYRRIREKYPLDPSGEDFGLIHGDLYPNNFRRAEDGRILLLDYEYAGICDIYYDLASLSIRMNGEQKKNLLTLYFGACSQAMLDKLECFKAVTLMWNGTWAYLKSCEVPKEVFDYVEFGDRHIHVLLGMIPDLELSAFGV